MTPEHSNFSEHSEHAEPSQPELITERLTLRHLREADIPDIVEACRDPQMIRYTRVPLNYTRADAEDSLLTTARQIAAGQIQRWAIDASGVFAGTIELRLADGTPESPGTRAELGYYTAPKARGKGYMTEALRAVLGYAFDPLGLGLETVRWTTLAVPSFELKYADMAANIDFIRLVFSNILGHLLSFSKDKNLNK